MLVKAEIALRGNSKRLHQIVEETNAMMMVAMVINPIIVIIVVDIVIRKMEIIGRINLLATKTRMSENARNVATPTYCSDH